MSGTLNRMQNEILSQICQHLPGSSIFLLSQVNRRIRLVFNNDDVLKVPEDVRDLTKFVTTNITNLEVVGVVTQETIRCLKHLSGGTIDLLALNVDRFQDEEVYQEFIECLHGLSPSNLHMAGRFNMELINEDSLFNTSLRSLFIGCDMRRFSREFGLPQISASYIISVINKAKDERPRQEVNFDLMHCTMSEGELHILFQAMVAATNISVFIKIFNVSRERLSIYKNVFFDLVSGPNHFSLGVLSDGIFISHVSRDENGEFVTHQLKLFNELPPYSSIYFSPVYVAEPKSKLHGIEFTGL